MHFRFWPSQWTTLKEAISEQRNIFSSSILHLLFFGFCSPIYEYVFMSYLCLSVYIYTYIYKIRILKDKIYPYSSSVVLKGVFLPFYPSQQI